VKRQAICHSRSFNHGLLPHYLFLEQIFCRGESTRRRTGARHCPYGERAALTLAVAGSPSQNVSPSVRSYGVYPSRPSRSPGATLHSAPLSSLL
jgi:hypothetical protein